MWKAWWVAFDLSSVLHHHHDICDHDLSQVSP
jgi:hypothetical protein